MSPRRHKRPNKFIIGIIGIDKYTIAIINRKNRASNAHCSLARSLAVPTPALVVGYTGRACAVAVAALSAWYL